MTSRMSPSRISLLQLLICSEPAILSKVQIWNGEQKENAKKVSIREDGSVFFYYGSGPLWWQRLFGAYKVVSIIDAAISIADAITGSNGTRNEIAFDGITKSILDEAVKKKDLDCVVDILFDSMRNCSDGELHSKYITQENLRRYAKEKNLQGNLKIEMPEDLFGFASVEIRPGVAVPIRIGRVKFK